MITNVDIRAAVRASYDSGGAPPDRVCAALRDLLPALRILVQALPFWLRWGAGALLGALDVYMDTECGPDRPL